MRMRCIAVNSGTVPCRQVVVSRRFVGQPQVPTELHRLGAPVSEFHQSVSLVRERPLQIRLQVASGHPRSVALSLLHPSLVWALAHQTRLRALAARRLPASSAETPQSESFSKNAIHLKHIALN